VLTFCYVAARPGSWNFGELLVSESQPRRRAARPAPNPGLAPEGSGAVGPDADDVQELRMPATDGLGGPAGELLGLGGQLLDAPGQQPEREHGCIVAVGKVGARGDQCCVAEAGQGLAQLGIDAEEYGLELVLRLRAGLDG
ncbi:hypothetical protein, partial [Streptomyces cahuitamycinicus]|uniref:hypothetical protein n=1 Tax=Streptomyces cahuitamycinicus TaxID=2070367 RepID=UPI001CA4B1D3